MLLEILEGARDERMDIIADIREGLAHGKELWFLGCGEFARRAKTVMDACGIPIAGACVNDEYYSNNTDFCGLPVKRLSTVLAKPQNKMILITFFSHELGEKAKQTLSATFPTYYADDWYNWFKMDYAFVRNNVAPYESFYNKLGDQLSKDVFIAYLRSHITGNGASLNRLRKNKQYQYDYELLQVSSEDIMLDCGAYNGDTIQNVASYLSGLPSRVVAFEPDQDNQRLLTERFKAQIDVGAVSVVPYGCDEENRLLRFYYGNGGDSCFATTDGGADMEWTEGKDFAEIQVVKIDDVVGEQPVTWIKMDIEGSELVALKGAQQTLIKNHPKLSICAYHRLGDLLDIPKYLESLSAEGLRYTFYLRHHGKSMSDTVLYALPQ